MLYRPCAFPINLKHISNRNFVVSMLIFVDFWDSVLHISPMIYVYVFGIPKSPRESMTSTTLDNQSVVARNTIKTLNLPS